MDEINDNDTISSPTVVERKRTKRRFPGPAGLLPSLASDRLDSVRKGNGALSASIENVISDGGQIFEETCSKRKRTQNLFPPSQESILEESTMRTLLVELGFDENNRKVDDMMSIININWISKRAAKLQLPAGIKIPFLLVTLQEAGDIAGANNRTGNFTLADSTGQIQAAFSPTLLEMHGSELSVGSSLALKNVNFLQYKRSVTLIITECNVICIASRPAAMESQRKRESCDSPSTTCSQRNICVTQLSVFNFEQMMEDLASFTHTAPDLNKSLPSHIEEDDRSFHSQLINVSSEDSEFSDRIGNYTPVANFHSGFPESDEDDLLFSQITDEAIASNFADAKSPSMIAGVEVDVLEHYHDDECFPDDDDEFFNILRIPNQTKY